MKYASIKLGLAVLLGAGFSMNAGAATCADVTWNQDAYAAYDQIDKACLEMVDRDGQLMAKLEAEVVAQSPSGTYVRFKHADGTQGPSTQLKNPDFVATVDGKPTAIKDLPARQDIRVYVSDAYWSLPQAEPMAAAAAAEPMAEPEPAPEPEPMPVMPVTAGNLGWLAVFGALFLVLGGALRYARQR